MSPLVGGSDVYDYSGERRLQELPLGMELKASALRAQLGSAHSLQDLLLRPPLAVQSQSGSCLMPHDPQLLSVPPTVSQLGAGVRS
jgi:hypothetical protein